MGFAYQLVALSISEADSSAVVIEQVLYMAIPVVFVYLYISY